MAANEQMATRALRVLALAIKHFNDNTEHSSDEALESGYTFVRLVGMIDPPRPGVASAIRRARVAGIRTV
jgi:P-type Ca2+ transporter type 2C